VEIRRTVVQDEHRQKKLVRTHLDKQARYGINAAIPATWEASVGGSWSEVGPGKNHEPLPEK
jgi:hypothetical protein